MKTLRAFLHVMDAQTLIVTVLALVSTYVCQRFGIVAEIPTSLIGLAVVFPIVFSINAAYKRREEALICLSGIKAHAMGLYYAHRDWLSSTGGGTEHAVRFKKIIEELLGAISSDLQPTGRSQPSHQRVMNAFSQLSRSHETLRKDKLGVSEVSRANQYMGKMLTDFARMSNIAIYRTMIVTKCF